VTARLERLPELCFELMAFGWSAGALFVLAGVARVPIAPWLLLLGYAVPALLKRFGAVWPVLGVLAVVVLAAVLVPAGDIAPAALIVLLQGARPILLRRGAPLSAMRLERSRGMTVLLLAALVQAILGRPDVWGLALFGAVFLAGALVGLPLAQGRAAGDPDYRRQLVHGLRLSGLVALLAAVLAVLIGVGRLLVHSGALDGLGAAVVWVLTPVSYVVGYIVGLLQRLLLRHHPKPNVLSPTKPAVKRGIKAHAASAVLLQHELWILIGIGLALVLVVLYLLYRRRRQEELLESPDANAPGGQDELRRASTAPRRGDGDYGAGARRIVRQAAGRHVHGRALPPATTARALAQAEGWPEDLLATYEHARYAFERPLPVSRARAFVAGLARFMGRRRRRTPPAP